MARFRLVAAMEVNGTAANRLVVRFTCRARAGCSRDPHYCVGDKSRAAELEIFNPRSGYPRGCLMCAISAAVRTFSSNLPQLPHCGLIPTFMLSRARVEYSLLPCFF
jgi:hypothetical protein